MRSLSEMQAVRASSRLPIRAQSVSILGSRVHRGEMSIFRRAFALLFGGFGLGLGCGILLSLAGGLLGESSRAGLATLLAICGCGFAAVDIASRGGMRLPQVDAELPTRWVLRPGLQATLPRIGYVAWFAIPAAALLSADVRVGAAVFGAYRAVRTAPPMFGLAIGRLEWLHAAFESSMRRSALRRGASFSLGVLSVTTLVVVGAQQ